MKTSKFFTISALICILGLSPMACKKADSVTPGTTNDELIQGSGIRNSGTTAKSYTVRMGLSIQGSVTANCLDIANGLTYSFGSASAKSTTVDMVVQKTFILDLGFYAPSSIPETQAWTRRKGTQFGDPNGIPAVDLTVWDKITTTGAIGGFTASLYDDQMYSLKEGMVVPVKTFEGVKALIRVNKIVGSQSDANSYVELQVKVAQ
jgi:hypothetical protein